MNAGTNPCAVTNFVNRAPGCVAFGCFLGAGWSSPVARQAHNLKVAGSNPAPATKKALSNAAIRLDGGFLLSGAWLLEYRRDCLPYMRGADLPLPDGKAATPE